MTMENCRFTNAPNFDVSPDEPWKPSDGIRAEREPIVRLPDGQLQCMKCENIYRDGVTAEAEDNVLSYDETIRFRALQCAIAWWRDVVGTKVDESSPGFNDTLKRFEAYIRNGNAS